jgi:hypothetical protein
MTDIEEKYLTTDKETEEESAREEEPINAKLCLSSTQSYADKLKVKFRLLEK